MFKKRNGGAHKANKSTATVNSVAASSVKSFSTVSSPTSASTAPSIPAALLSPLAVSFDFDIPSPPSLRDSREVPRPATSDGAARPSLSLAPPILPPIPRVSSRTSSFHSATSHISLGQEEQRPGSSRQEDDQRSESLSPTSAVNVSKLSGLPSIEPAVLASRPSTAGGVSSVGSAPRMEASLFPKIDPPPASLPVLNPALNRSFVDSRDRPYHQGPPPALTIRQNQSVPDLRLNPTDTFPETRPAIPAIPQTPTKAPSKRRMSFGRPKTQSSAQPPVSSLSTIGTPYGATSSSFPLPQHVKTRPRTAGGTSKLAGVDVLTYHTSAIPGKGPEEKAEGKKEAKQADSKKSETKSKGESTKKADAKATKTESKPAESKASKENRKTRRFTMNLLARRKTQLLDADSFGDDLSEKAARSIASPIQDLPDFDPRIKGPGVHDFSLPRNQRNTFIEHDLASPRSGPFSPPLDGGFRSSFSNESTARDSIGGGRRNVHTPIFTEHLDEVPETARRISSLQAENLENKEFLYRASKQSFTNNSQESAVLPPFARRSQAGIDPLLTAPLRDATSRQSSDGVSEEKERDSAISSSNDVSPVAASSGGSASGMRDSHSPVSPSSEARPFVFPPNVIAAASVAQPELLSPQSTKPQAIPPPAVPEEKTMSKSGGSSPEQSVSGRSGGKKSFRFVEKLMSAATGGSKKNQEVIPKHQASNASRFSFQFGDSDEQALEQGHRKQQENGDKPVTVSAGNDYDDDDDDYFDENAMDDLDEMELAESQQQQQAQQNALAFGLPAHQIPQMPPQPPSPAHPPPQLTHAPSATSATSGRSDNSNKTDRAQSLRYLQQARQVLKDDDSVYGEDDDVLGEEREVTYADHPAFRTHSALGAYSRRGSEGGNASGFHSRQSSMADGTEGYWRGGTIDDYMHDYTLSASNSVASTREKRNRQNSTTQEPPSAIDSIPEDFDAISRRRDYSKPLVTAASAASEQPVVVAEDVVSPRGGILPPASRSSKGRTISEMSFSTTSDDAHPVHQMGAGTPLRQPVQSRLHAVENNRGLQTEGSSERAGSRGGSTVTDSVSSGHSLMSSQTSGPYSDGTNGNSSSSGGKPLSRLQDSASPSQPRQASIGGAASPLRQQRRTSRAASSSTMSMNLSSPSTTTGKFRALTPSTLSTPNRFSSASQLRPRSDAASRLILPPAELLGTGTLSMIEVAESSDSEDELVPGHWDPSDGSDIKTHDLFLVAPPKNGYLAPSPTIHSYPNSPVPPSPSAMEPPPSPNPNSLTSTALVERESIDDERDLDVFVPTIQAPPPRRAQSNAAAAAASAPLGIWVRDKLRGDSALPLLDAPYGSSPPIETIYEGRAMGDDQEEEGAAEPGKAVNDVPVVASSRDAVPVVDHHPAGSHFPVAHTAEIVDEDDMYFDDGNFGGELDAVEGETIDESKFDDDDFLSRPNAHHLQLKDRRGLPADGLPAVHDAKVGQLESLQVVESLQHQNCVAVPDGYGHPQAGLQQYHAALADAATQAAADGRFMRMPSLDTAGAVDPSLPVGVNGEKHDLANGYLSANATVASPTRSGAFDFGFDQMIGGEDSADDFEQDDDLIAAANAEALASDDEGFYGQEFQFYGRPRSNSGEVEAVNGGYFGEDGDDGLTRNKSLREPNLTPITERSEFSTRNSFINMSQFNSGGSMSSNPYPYGGHSPAMTLARIPTSPLMPGDDVASFEQLRKLRANAFGGGGGGGSDSAGSNRSSSHSLNATPGPNAPFMTRTPSSQLAQGSASSLGVYGMTPPSTTSSASNLPPATTQAAPVTVTIPQSSPPTYAGSGNALFTGFNFQETSPVSPTDTYSPVSPPDFLSPAAKKQPSSYNNSVMSVSPPTPTLSRNASIPHLGNVMMSPPSPSPTQPLPAPPTQAPQIQFSPAAQYGDVRKGTAADVVPNGQSHSTAAMTAVPASANGAGVLHHPNQNHDQRTSDGQLEIIGRELIQGGWI